MCRSHLPFYLFLIYVMILCAQDPQRQGEPAGQLRQEPVPIQDRVRVRQVQSNVSDEKKYFFLHICMPSAKNFFLLFKKYFN